MGFPGPGRETNLRVDHVRRNVEHLWIIDHPIILVRARSSTIAIIIDPEPLQRKRQNRRGLGDPKRFRSVRLRLATVRQLMRVLYGRTHFSQWYLLSPSSLSSLMNPASIFPRDGEPPFVTSRLRSRNESKVSDGLLHREQTTRDRIFPPQVSYIHVVCLTFSGASLRSDVIAKELQRGGKEERGDGGRKG